MRMKKKMLSVTCPAKDISNVFFFTRIVGKRRIEYMNQRRHSTHFKAHENFDVLIGVAKTAEVHLFR